MIDTHCHLSDPRLLGQIDAVLGRAAAAGVKKMVTIGTDPADWDAALSLAKKYPQVRCSVGGHPNNAAEFEFTELSRLADFTQHAEVVALGEMGLDYHHHFADRSRQQKYFQAQLETARDLSMPVIIHSRDATDDCLAILRAFPSVRAVFHCFTGTKAEASRIWDAGYLTGFTGVVTFKNGAELREIAALAPPDRILVETDAPYLTPEPMRKQKINEPAMVIHTARTVAEARGITLEELDDLTSKNAEKFYRSFGD